MSTTALPNFIIIIIIRLSINCQLESEISQQLLVWFPPNFKLRVMRSKQTLKVFQMKTTSTGRWLQMEYYLKYQKWYISATTGQIFPKFVTLAHVIKANFANVSNEHTLVWKTSSNWRLPQISKVKYLSNYWSDLPQILNLDLCDQTKFFKCFKWR
jgi:hypothetical protein